MSMMNTTIIKSYSELIKLPTFEERYQYLKLSGIVGEETFGFDRIFNQQFYRSQQWKSVRNRVILRDNGCDLGIEGHQIFGRILIHHINPISLHDLEMQSELLLSLDNLICVSHNTHQAIHYGDETLLSLPPKDRTPNDTCPWKRL